jgi:formylglycine-generating enzyme required for sulfatase activity
MSPLRPDLLPQAVLLVLALGGCRAGEPPSAIEPVPRFTTGVGLEFQYIPGGTFTMGGPEFMATPRHQVTLSPFYVAREPVAKGLFRRFLTETGRTGNRDEMGPDPVGWTFENQEQWEKLPAMFWRGAPTELHAVHWQSLQDAKALADWMTKKEGRPFRVITEAQLEYVMRCGVAKGDEEYWWLGVQPGALGNWAFDGEYNAVGPEMGNGLVRLYPANAWGLYLGSLFLLTQDRYAEYPPTPQVDPTGPTMTLDGFYAVRVGNIAARSKAPPDKSDAGILLVADPLPSDRHPPVVVDPGPPPALEPIEPLAERQLDLGGGVNLTMRQIQAGRFTMGRPQKERPWTREWPETEVEMTPYWLGTTEVTQAQFRAVTGINPSLIKGDTLPVHSVVMAEMLAFCDLLTARERAASRLGADEEYRLPTEAEWERAALAGRRTLYAHGDDSAQLHWYAWFDVLDGPHPVAAKLPNRWGFYDMEGNILEILCERMFRLPGDMQHQHWMPMTIGWGGMKDWHAARGGAWNMGAMACEPTIRRAVQVNSRTYHMGFRLARGPVLPVRAKDPRDPGWRWVFEFNPYRSSKTYSTVMQSAPAEWPRPTWWKPPEKPVEPSK